MKLWMVIALIAVLAIVAVLGNHLYWKDAGGVRTLVAKQFPANYEKQNLVEHRFVGAWLPHANFKGANLREAEFSDANARHADFSGADFTMAGVSGADFTGAIFDGATWNTARGHETAIYRNASFRNTDLSQRSFHGMGGQHNRSKRQHMMDPGYGGADLSGAIFDGAKCVQTYFNRTNLTGASFKGADCRDANFTNADLRNADFTNADLRGAKMDGANTVGAVFTNARLK
ncbi:MAG: pentapeptide repeat-containing protein [Burkholderiales bacterium]